MGLLTALLSLPISGPINGLMFLAEQIRDRVETEEFDEGIIEDSLMVLSLRHDLGEISDADFFAEESVLLERFNAALARKESIAEHENAWGGYAH